MKRVISSMLVLLMLLSMMPVSVFAATGQTEGNCGGVGNEEGVTYSIVSGKLTISGTGAMADYTAGNTPWYWAKDTITRIEFRGSVSYIGDYAFAGMDNVTTLVLPMRNFSIGDYVCYGCNNLTMEYISSGCSSVGEHCWDGVKWTLNIYHKQNTTPTPKTMVNTTITVQTGQTIVCPILTEIVQGARWEFVSGHPNNFVNYVVPDTGITEAVATDGLVRVYEKAHHTVTYDSPVAATGVPAPATVESGATATQPDPPPTAAGWTFQGWYIDQTFSSQFNFNTPITDDTTIYAFWHPDGGYVYKTEHYAEQLDGTYKMVAVQYSSSAAQEEVTAPVATIEHHTFDSEDGRNELTGTTAAGATPDNCLTLKRYYKLDTVQVSYVTTPGTAVAPVTLKWGAPSTKPNAPTRTGYVFENWYTDSGCNVRYTFGNPVTADMTLYAKWTARTYTVDFTDTTDTIEVAYDSPYGTLPVPYKQGYVFKGWFPDEDCTGTQVTADTIYTIAGASHLYPKWEPATNTPYTVTHMTQNVGTSTYSVYKTEQKYGTTGADVTGAAITIPHFTQAGAIATEPVRADGSTDIKVYYSRDQYQVTFDASPATGVLPQNIPYEGTATRPADPYNQGYHLAGWYTESTYDNVYDFATQVTGATTLYAKWEPNTDTAYTVQHFQMKVDGTYAATPTTITSLTGTTATVPTLSANTYPGFHVDRREGESNAIAANGSSVYKIYYARDTMTITAGSDTYNVRYGQTLADANIPAQSKTGYTFRGWVATEGGTNVLGDGYVINQNITIYPYFIPDGSTLYTVEHYQQDLYSAAYNKVVDADDTLYGTTDSSVTASPRNFPGFHLADAQPDKSGTIAGDGSLVLKVYYDRDMVTVKFGDESKEVRYGTPASGQEPVTNPTKQGYVFEAWKTADGKTPDEVTITEYTEFTAAWTAATNTPYKVEYYLQPITGTEYEHDTANDATLQGTTDAVIEPPTVTPTIAGFTFERWDKASAPVAADGSLVFRGYYKRNTVSVTNTETGTSTDLLYGQTLGDVPKPTRTGTNPNVDYSIYEFVRWEDASGNEVQDSFVLYADLAVAPVWQVKADLKPKSIVAAVKNGANNEVLADATVTVYAGDVTYLTTITDEWGIAYLGTLDPATYNMTIKKDGVIENSYFLEMLESPTTTSVTVIKDGISAAISNVMGAYILDAAVPYSVINNDPGARKVVWEGITEFTEGTSYTYVQYNIGTSDNVPSDVTNALDALNQLPDTCYTVKVVGVTIGPDGTPTTENITTFTPAIDIHIPHPVAWETDTKIPGVWYENVGDADVSCETKDTVDGWGSEIKVRLNSIAYPEGKPYHFGTSHRKPATLTLIGNGGKIEAAESVTELLQEVTEVPVATREYDEYWDYTFDGWWTDPESGTRMPSLEALKENDVNGTYYAHWTKETRSLITLDAAGGTVDGKATVQLSLRNTTTLPAAVRDWTNTSKYNFLGWFTEKKGGTQVTNLTEYRAQGKPVTFYAHWEATKRVTIRFEANGGKVNNSDRVDIILDTITSLPQATKASDSTYTYTFKGWYTAKDGGTMMELAQLKKDNKDVTLYAQWEKRVRYTGGGGGGSTKPTTPPDYTIKVDNPFSDVKLTDWYANYVLICYKNKWMEPVSSTKFDPSGDSTRAVTAFGFAKIKGSGELTSGYETSPFQDISRNTYGYRYIEWCRQHGIFAGTSSTTFGMGNLTREQMCALLYRALNHAKVKYTPNRQFDDFRDASSVSLWAREAVRWAVDNGLMVGDGSRLNPHSTISRAELCAMLVRTEALVR